METEDLNHTDYLDYVLDCLDENGIRVTEESLEELGMYILNHEFTDHHRNFELFQQGDGRYLVNIEGHWYMTEELLH